MKNLQLCYPSNKELTGKHNFLANVPKSKINSKYLKITQKGNTKRMKKCNVHLSQKDCNIFHSILSQWFYKSYDTKKEIIKNDWLEYDISKGIRDVGMNNYTRNDDYSRRSSNKTNNIKEVKRRIDNILSFVIEVRLGSCIHKFHFIEEIKIYPKKPNIIEIKLSKSFLTPFLERKIQIVPLLIVKGEYQQKILEYLLTEVQYRQNLVGIHKERQFRFRAFELQKCINFFQINEEYNSNPDKIRRKITKSLKSVREQINSRDLDIRIPEYRYYNGKYKVKDYCYLD